MSTEYNFPIVDCTDIISGSLQNVENTAAFKIFTQNIGDGMRNFGFVYLVNHGITPEKVENLFMKSREFFQLPAEVKAKYKKVNQVVSFHGFTSSDEENAGELDRKRNGAPGVALPDLKEAFDFVSYYAKDESSFPSEVSGFKQAADEFRSSLTHLVEKSLRAFADYLKLKDPDCFIKEHKSILADDSIKSQTFIRSNYYFPLEQNEGTKPDEIINTQRLGAHSDIGTLTFLFQDECGGLEARAPDGVWADVKPIKNSIVLNGGFLLEAWSGGNLPAAQHRVQAFSGNRTRLRQSVGLFVNPDITTEFQTFVTNKPNWEPAYSYTDRTTHFEFFKEVVSYMREK